MGKIPEDDRLEDRLRSLPEQKDRRTREEVLSRLQEDERISGELRGKVRRRRMGRIPILAAAAVFLVAAGLAPLYLQQDDDNRESAYSTAEDREDKAAEDGMEDAQDEAMENQAAEARVILEEDEFSMQHAAYADHLEGRLLLHAGLKDARAGSVPVTFVISEEQLHRKGLGADADGTQIWKAFADELAEEESSYVPLETEEFTEVPFYEFTQEDGRVMLAPDVRKKAATFTEAVGLMQSDAEEPFRSPIPAGVRVTVQEEDGTAVAAFDPALSLERMDMDQAALLVDSLTLTAAGFGLALELRNVQPEEWFGFDFSRPLPAAAGANPRTLPDRED